MFIDPSTDAVRRAACLGADFVELHTGHYADSNSQKAAAAEFKKIADAARLAKKLGLGVNAGHGLNYSNIKPLRKIEEIQEYSIGHSVISRAVMVGLRRAVLEMIALIK